MNSDRDPQSDSDTDSNTEPNYGSDPLRAETDSPVADRLAEFAFEVQRAERQLACDSVELHYQDKGDGEGKTAEIVARYGGED